MLRGTALPNQKLLITLKNVVGSFRRGYIFSIAAFLCHPRGLCATFSNKIHLTWKPKSCKSEATFWRKPAKIFFNGPENRFLPVFFFSSSSQKKIKEIKATFSHLCFEVGEGKWVWRSGKGGKKGRINKMIFLLWPSFLGVVVVGGSERLWLSSKDG